MTDQHLELEGTATGNDAPELETTSIPAEDAKLESAAKPVTLDDALASAFDKHTEKRQDDPAPKKAAAAALSNPDPEPDKPIDPITGRTLEPIKAPNGWTPALREKWGTIDPQVQKFIIDRERDMSNKLNQTADERKLAGSFKDVAAPYEAMLRQFNTTAVDHAKELFNLSHTLNTGTAQTKAQVIYNLINHFKPDPATLQGLFAGHAPQMPPAPQAPNVAAEVEKALAARAEQEQQTQVQREVQAFSSDPKNEFFDDVRDLMGKIIDAGLVDGKTMPELFQNAYDLACKQHPEIAPILAQRTQTQAFTPVAAPAAKPIASVKPSLGAGKSAKQQPRKMSMDDAIATAMAQHGVSL